MSAPDYTAENATLRAILNVGTTSMSVDGQSTAFDLDAVRRRLNELERISPDNRALVRPRVSSIRLGGAW